MPTPEDKAREEIDRLLTQAGWSVPRPDRDYVAGVKEKSYAMDRTF
jgi:hypothetical protein